MGWSWLAAGLAVGLALSLSGDVRAWAVDTLFYAWVPVSLWTIALVFTIRHHHLSLAAGWGYWLLGGGVVAIIVGALSIFPLGSRISSDASLGGHWGSALGGDSLGLAVVKLIAIAVIVPPVLFPKTVGITWVRALGKIGRSSKTWTLWFSVTRLLVRVKDGVARYLRLRRAPTTSGRTSQRSTTRTEPAADPEGSWISPDVESFAMEELSAYSDLKSGSLLESTTGLLPGTTVLSKAESAGPDAGEFEETARLIEETLGSYGEKVEVRDIQVGPRLVRYGLSPGWPGQGEEGSEEDSGKRGSVTGLGCRVSWPERKISHLR